jgi:hypothetical protein
MSRTSTPCQRFLTSMLPECTEIEHAALSQGESVCAVCGYRRISHHDVTVKVEKIGIGKHRFSQLWSYSTCVFFKACKISCFMYFKSEHLMISWRQIFRYRRKKGNFDSHVPSSAILQGAKEFYIQHTRIKPPWQILTVLTVGPNHSLIRVMVVCWPQWDMLGSQSLCRSFDPSEAQAA